MQNYTTTFMVDQTPQEVYNSISNAKGWWSELIEGDTKALGSIFYYHFKDIHRCTLKVAESVPGERVVWHVLQNYFNLDAIHEKTEWTGTDIVFDISKKGDKTEVKFTHVGLVPEYECFNICSDGWLTYINGSLQSLITTGKGAPNVGEAITNSEKELNK